MEAVPVVTIFPNGYNTDSANPNPRPLQPITDKTPIGEHNDIYNQDDYLNLNQIMNENHQIVQNNIPPNPVDEPYTKIENTNCNNDSRDDPQTSVVPLFCSDPTTNNDVNQNSDSPILHSDAPSNTNNTHCINHALSTDDNKPTDLNNSIKIIESNTQNVDTEVVHEIEIIQSSEQNNNTETIESHEAHSMDSNAMDLDEEQHNIPSTECNIAPNNEHRIESESVHKADNDPGIGTEQPTEKQHFISSDKEEMDIDEPEPEPEPQPQTPITRNTLDPNEPPPDTKTNNNPDPPNVQQTNITNLMAIDGYDEEQDEDFNEEEEEEDDESDEHSEDIAGDEDESDHFYSELADIDIVRDDKIYTEEAPRWLISIDDGAEFNVESAYQQWELDKQKYGTIYDEDAGNDADGDADIDHDNANECVGFFESLLEKYAAKHSEDPEKDKIKKKGGDYKLDDNFIDDTDCFQQNGVETLFPGFFISRGYIDVKKPAFSPTSQRTRPRKKSVKRNVVIAETYKKKIVKIQNAVRSHQEVMNCICKQRNMNGMVKNKEKYIQFAGMDTMNENDTKEDDEDTIDIYKKLLLMVIEFDTTLFRDKVSASVKGVIYHELAPAFEYDINESNRKQQMNFEELLNWFSYDWYDDTDDVSKGRKMNWRILFLDVIKNRAKARFHNKMNKVRKENSDKSKKYQAADIPWDQIVAEIFLITCYSMESAALLDNDTDKAAHECHMQLRESISKYLEGGVNAINMTDIETRYNDQTKKAFPNPSYCYSYLVVQRIKEILRNDKKQKKTPKKASPKRSKKSPPKKPVVDLTNNSTNISPTHTNNRQHIASSDSSPSPLAPAHRMESNDNINIEAHAPVPVTFRQNNAIIDLTGNEATNTMNDSEAITNTNTDTNTPKTERKPLQSRKRKRAEMDPEMTQPLMKRRKLTEKLSKAEFVYSQPIVQREKAINSITFEPHKLIAVQESNDLKDGATVCMMVRTEHDKMWYRDYATGSIAPQPCAITSCYVIQEYMNSSTPSDLISDSNTVLVLRMNDENEFESKYVLGQVTYEPQHNTDQIGIRYHHNGQEMRMPLRTSPKTVVFQRWETIVIPTVIRINPISLIVDENRQGNDNVNANDNANANDNNEHHQASNDNDNDNDNNNNNNVTNGNGNGHIMTMKRHQPPSSNRFYCNLPSDPWNDEHFQGDDR